MKNFILVVSLVFSSAVFAEGVRVDYRPADGGIVFYVGGPAVKKLRCSAKKNVCSFSIDANGTVRALPASSKVSLASSLQGQMKVLNAHVARVQTPVCGGSSCVSGAVCGTVLDLSVGQNAGKWIRVGDVQCRITTKSALGQGSIYYESRVQMNVK